MRKLLLTFVLFLFALPCASAQSSSSSDQGAPTQSPSDKDQKSDKDKEKKKKDKKKKDKDKSDQDSTAKDINTVFSERTADDVLGQIRDGLEGHSRRLMLGAFDSDKMDGYLNFEDQIDALFNRYNSFRVHFRIANVQLEGTKGLVLVDAEMEESPANGGAPVRKRTQLRFELEQGRKGWKVVDFRDRNFFS
jgi:hypothetical protein